MSEDQQFLKVLEQISQQQADQALQSSALALSQSLTSQALLKISEQQKSLTSQMGLLLESLSKEDAAGSSVLEKISEQQIELAKSQSKTLTVLIELVEELKKPPEVVSTLIALEALLTPLLLQLAELSRKLPELSPTSRSTP